MEWLALLVMTMQGAPVLACMRWQTRQHLKDGQGVRCAWQIARGKRSLDHRLFWDCRRQCWCKTDIFYCPVTHRDYPNHPLFLVVSRPGKGFKPCYLLTNESLASVDDAWRIILIYARRWQVEMTCRYAKTELAFESPRLSSWHNRLKLLMMVALFTLF
jgi:hypothetical protein